MANRVFNFNPGPSTLPLEVLKIVQEELLDYRGTGMSIIESSHRSPEFDEINNQAMALAKEILGLGDNYKENIYPQEAVCSVNDNELSKISSFKTPGKVIAVLRMPEYNIDKNDIIAGLSLVLDTVQDPGNLGNIIRIADWFGIRNIFCSYECADCYNPKVVQSTMGAIIRVNLYYVDLRDLLEEYSSIPDFTIYGTFLKGDPVHNRNLDKKAFIVLGNESKGIAERYLPYIKSRLFIPKYDPNNSAVESLNVSAAAAIICYEFRRR